LVLQLRKPSLRSEQMLVGIIGGNGAMGSLFKGVFERAGHRVICSGRNTPLSNSSLATQSDIVLVSVPVRSTVEVIDEIAPLLTEKQIICDLTSLKSDPVSAMLKSRAQVIGLHPMFGPTVLSLKGQTIIATPARCDEETAQIFYSVFRNEGAKITVTTPEKHDLMMAVVQGLTHFATLSLAETMRALEMDLDMLLSFTSPVYRIEMGLIGRILGQNPDLYGDILQMNPAVPGVLAQFEDSVSRFRSVVEGGDAREFEEFFSECREKFSEFIPQAASETDLIIDALVNR